MMNLSRLVAATALLLLASGFTGLAWSPNGLPAGVEAKTLLVDGQPREALIYTPPNAKTDALPVVFVFHGHGGTMRYAIRALPMNEQWPDAISVYPQGLKTATPLVDVAGHFPGWQIYEGQENDRDLKFFDALLALVEKEHHVDPRRVYVTGHSNGGFFDYLLWKTRESKIAAVAPIAAAANFAADLKPKPALIVAGEKDPIVKPVWQTMTIAAVLQVNGCKAEGQPWEDGATLHPSSKGAPTVTLVHPGGHGIPANALKLIARFFQENPAPGH